MTLKTKLSLLLSYQETKLKIQIRTASRLWICLQPKMVLKNRPLWVILKLKLTPQVAILKKIHMKTRNQIKYFRKWRVWLRTNRILWSNLLWLSILLTFSSTAFKELHSCSTRWVPQWSLFKFKSWAPLVCRHHQLSINIHNLNWQSHWVNSVQES